MSSKILAKFQRITTSGQFIPEIDGLRCIAITAVAMFHISHYLSTTNHYSYTHAPGRFSKWALDACGTGSRGVEIFFVVSGFILALPFASRFLRNGKSISLGHYYLRRITRLEPPYFLAMSLCFLLIWHRRYLIADYPEYGSSFKASLFYLHNLLWPRGTLPLVNPVTWSLEIEVQFYLIAPFVARIYLTRKNLRRSVVALAIASKICIPASLQLPHLSLADYFDFFLIGFLLADLYVDGKLAVGKRDWLHTICATVLFFGLWSCPIKYLAILIGLFFYCSFKSSTIRGILSNRWLTTVGGMCYSIYLIHWVLITTLGGRIVQQFTRSYAVDFLIHASLLMGMILITGAIYFKLIEQPCMSRDWPKRLYIRVASIFSPRPATSRN